MFLDWLFTKQITLESDLTIDELFSRLRTTMKAGLGHIEKAKYSGLIDGRLKTFNFSKSITKFEYSHTKSSIKGSITNSQQGNTRLIKLDVSISYGKALVIISLSIAILVVLAYIVIVLANLFQPNNSVFPKINGNYLLIGLLLAIIYCTPLIVFHLKIYEVIEDLSFIFKAKKI